MENLIYIPIVAGMLCAAFLAYWTTRPIVARMRRTSDRFNLAPWFSVLGAIALALPAMVLAMVIGGAIAGALGDIGLSPELQRTTMPFFLFLTIAIVAGGGLAVGTLAGAFVSRMLSSALWRAAKP
jgi:hypothetical protein